MIQRIQTIFMFLAVVALALLFFFPIVSITELTNIKGELLETDYYKLMASGIDDPSPDSKPQVSGFMVFPLSITAIAIMILLIYAISRYKNRLHQIKLNKFSILLNVFLIAGIFLNYPKLFADVPIEIGITTGAYFPLVSVVLIVVSNKYILKDEKLVRSMDRLRKK